MKRLCARYVPRLLILEQKRNAKCLQLFEKNSADFLQLFVTMNETWIHHYTPETKLQSKYWTKQGEPTSKKAKSFPFAEKVMA